MISRKMILVYICPFDENMSFANLINEQTNKQTKQIVSQIQMAHNVNDKILFYEWEL